MGSALVVWLALSPICQAAYAAWTSVGNGIDYQQFTLTVTPPDTNASPNVLYVARMLRSNTNATLEASMANGTNSGANEVMTSQSARYDDAINYWGANWGQRNDVVVAINGDFWADGRFLHGQCQSGWYTKKFGYAAGGTQFGWTMNRVPWIANVYNITNSGQIVSFTQSATTQAFQDINRARGANELIIYTPQYNSTTMTDNTGVEVLVQMTRPAMILPANDPAIGYVRQIRPNAGSTPIPFDCIVLSATGTAATSLLNNAVLGGEVKVSQQAITAGVDTSKTFAAVGGNFQFLTNGVIQPSTDPSITEREPRTSIAYNNTYIFYVVCDGRSSASVGMTGTEIGTFCRDTLGADNAMNCDGGGSSTMVVNGTLMNVPSDGSERAVQSGMMMINVLPKLQSAAFATGRVVRTTGSANVRLGPGTNYAVTAAMPTDSVGTLRDHPLAGVYAKGYYWWNVDFGSTYGWVAETLLADVADAPSVASHPVSQTFCAGDTLSLTVSATGPGPLSYQWQKNSSNLTDGTHYVGVTTSTLNLLNVDSSDVAGYRCLVSNSSGTVISREAYLTPIPTPPTPTNAGEQVTTSSINWSWLDVSGETGYRLKDGNGISVSGDLPANSTQWSESGLTPNAPYTRYVYAFARCMESAASAVRTRYPLAKAGASTDGTQTTGNVYCTTATAGGWYGLTKTFTFSNPAGFGVSTPGGSEWKATGFEYKWNTSPTETWGGSGSSWSSGTKSFTPTSGQGSYYLHVRAKNGNQNWNNVDDLDYGPFRVDATSPGAVSAVTDEGAFTPSLTTLKAQWTPATDPESGIQDYQYAIGTSTGQTNVKGWTSAGNTTSLTDSALTLTEGSTYYIQVRAVNQAGLTGPATSSNGILAAPGVARIPLLWPMANSVPLSLRNKTVTCVASGAFWLEEHDRTGAIKVMNGATVAPGNTVSVAGVLTVSGPQRVLLGDVIENSGGNTKIDPLGMITRSTGGAAAALMPGVTGGASPYNIGLLVRCWGTVTYADSTNSADRFFYLDDGCGLSDGSGHLGIKVRCGGTPPPEVSRFTSVSGVVASESAGERVVPVLISSD